MEQWSDEELRQALQEHSLFQGIPVTSSTRQFMIRKLQAALNTPPSASPAATACVPESPQVINDQSHCPSMRAKGYYGVAAVLSTPNDDGSTGHPHLSPFYTNKSDALKAIKGIPGARFKKFDSQSKAESFSQQTINESGRDERDLGQVSSPDKNFEKANTFPSLKTPDLNMFRIMIEKGDIESFLECVRRNPRYLINSGDAPEILKPPTRYNALHCAVIAGQVDICRQLLWVLQDNNFWAMVYPDDNPENVRPSRKEHLLDLYLNMQDKGFGETPLHFACKWGHTEIVALLLSLPLTSTTIKNKEGKTPAEIICQKQKNLEVKTKIEELLAEPEIFYVPVLRTEDNSTPPQLGHPVTLGQLDAIESQVDGCELPQLSNGLAGPMSPKEAKHFYQDWRSPGRSTGGTRELVRIKRADSERGMERIGRQLAHKSNVGWTEYWDFLGTACDLSKPEGFELLEDYLQCRSGNDCMGPVDRESPLIATQNSIAGVENSRSSSKVSCKLFDEDVVEEAGVTMEDSPYTSPVDADVLSEIFSQKASLRVDEDPVFISGDSPTKLDYDVFLALCSVTPDPLEYPCITKWLGLLDNFSEEDKKTWKTPRKLPSDNTSTSTPHPVSPLVFSSPSLQTYGSSSPLVASGTSLGRSRNSTNNTPTMVRYWPRQPTTPRGRTPHSLNGSISTTPRRNAHIMTPTRYEKLSYTPKIL